MEVALAALVGLLVDWVEEVVCAVGGWIVTTFGYSGESINKQHTRMVLTLTDSQSCIIFIIRQEYQNRID